MAFRLIFEAQGNEIRLVRRERVDMLAPATTTDPAERRAGIYAEVLNDRKETLYQTNLSPQLDAGVEVFAPSGEVQRVDAPERRRIVMVVVPETPEAESLVVVKRASPFAASERVVNAESVETDEVLVRVSLTNDEPDR